MNTKTLVTLTLEGSAPVQGAAGSTLLELAEEGGIEIEHACGGACACSTCHVIVVEGEENLSPTEEDEEDRLDQAEGLTLHSRLACQARILRGAATVRVPSSNRANSYH